MSTGIKKSSNSNVLKSALVALNCIVAITAIGSYISGQLFPWLPVMMVLSAFILITSGRKIGLANWITLSILIGVFYRIFSYDFADSIPWMDADRVALAIHKVMLQGSTDPLYKLPFYSTAPLSHIYGAISGLIQGTGASGGLITIGISLAIIAPIFAAELATQISIASKRFAAGIAATLGLVGMNTLLYGFAPVPQVLATIYWFVFLYTINKYFLSRKYRDLILPFVFTITMSLTHKLGLVLILSTLVVRAAILFINGLSFRGFHSKYYRKNYGIILMCLFFLCLSVQWIFLTNYVRPVILGAIIPLLSPSLVAAAPEPIYLGAEKLTSGLWGTFYTNMNWLVYVPIVGVAALLHWRKSSKLADSLILGAFCVSVILLASSIFSSGLATTQRVLLYSEVIFAALVSVTVAEFWINNPKNITNNFSNGLILLLLMILVLSQVAPPNATIDHPDGTRSYLTSPEIAGKNFASQKTTATVYTDYYYAVKVADFNRKSASYVTGERAIYELSKFGVLDEGLANKSLRPKKYPTIALRSINKFWLSIGRYRLTWNPIKVVSNSPAYSKVYSNGGVNIYTSEFD